MDVRVQDYLDDRLQSVADLESLDSLLQTVKDQQALLKKQLEDARKTCQAERQEAQRQGEAVRQQAEAFQKQQEDIDLRLRTITQSDSNEQAVQSFDVSMKKLQKLDIATGYVELLASVETLKNDCTSQLGRSDDAALEPYQRLQQLANSLRPLQAAADGAAPHLLHHVNASVQDLHDALRKSFSANLEKTLQKLNWPKFATAIPLALQKEWTTNIGRLLDLQRHDLEARELEKGQLQEGQTPVLLPFEVLVVPLEQRFSYHFSGNKPTNRLEKPEFFLNHVVELISKYTDFVQDTMQPILLRHFRGSNLAFTPAYIDATTAFITALLPMLKHKLLSVANQVSSQPALLSHLVQEVISFDTTLSESYAYTPAAASTAWRGLAHHLLDTCGFFAPWLVAEREFALARYTAIVEAADANELDYDSVAADASKPPKAAMRVNDLLETVTQRYRGLASYAFKTRFLIDVQVELFDRYFQRLRAALDAQRSLASAVGRTINHVSSAAAARDEAAAAASAHGTRALDRLCRVFGAADFLERAMRDWSDDVFFLDLWAELDFRARTPSAAAGMAAGNGSSSGSTWYEIQQKTSAALAAATGTGADAGGAASASAEGGGLEGALFDETASKYRSLRERSEAALADTLTASIKQALRPYAGITTWASLSSSSSSSPPSAAATAATTSSSLSAPSAHSAELDPLLAQLAESLGFLRRAVGRAALRRLARAACRAVQAFVWDSVLGGFKVGFSTAGAAQLAADMRAVCALVDRYAGAGQAQTGMRRLLEGVTLLGLPIRGEGGGQGADDDGSAWDEGADEDMGIVGGSQPQGSALSLFQVEKMVFKDNEGARRALEQLGLTTLSEADARAVLEKRVERGG